jgi:hypothetical protein
MQSRQVSFLPQAFTHIYNPTPKMNQQQIAQLPP